MHPSPSGNSDWHLMICGLSGLRCASWSSLLQPGLPFTVSSLATLHIQPLFRPYQTLSAFNIPGLLPLATIFLFIPRESWRCHSQVLPHDSSLYLMRVFYLPVTVLTLYTQLLSWSQQPYDTASILLPFHRQRNWGIQVKSLSKVT